MTNLDKLIKQGYKDIKTFNYESLIQHYVSVADLVDNNEVINYPQHITIIRVFAVNCKMKLEIKIIKSFL